MIRLASTPMPHVTRMAQSVLDVFRNQDVSNTLHRPIPAPEPNPEPNPEPDAGPLAARASIAPDDWDELFHAIQTRLENCVDEALNQVPELPLHERHEVIKAHVLDCVASMRQLHASLAVERMKHPQ
jgi:hypothetical protein